MSDRVVSHPPPATRVALLTGGARGIGLASARRLGRAGIFVALADIDAAAAESAAAQLRGEGIEAEGYRLDVADPASVKATVVAVERDFGSVDILLNSAGVLPRVAGRNPTVEDMPLDIWNLTLAVNLTGPFLMAQACIPLMKRRGWGRIVTISSRSARTRTFGNAHYSASKSGLAGLHRIMANEVGAFGITVNCIAPSRVNTELNNNLADGGATLQAAIRETPVGRIAEPEDIAAAVAYLASDDASFVTGAILDLTGGSFMP
jgi:3-oxoacyl-[acyl-carrier protein] reductase